jgi:predicted nucleic acid-binding protein
VALSTATYLADRSALARFPIPAVAARLRPLMEEGLLATCAIVDLDVLYSTRNLRDYEEILEERRSFDAAPITPEVMARSIELQHELARRGQHRVPILDLVVSAAAGVAGLVVLHYDNGFARLAAVGGAQHEWVVTQGSV